jgi:CheY-like chemotaxis protein
MRDTILCVDDEENQLTVRKLVLEGAGYRVLTASSGQEALNLLDFHRIDLVLSDHLMPGLTGTELARQIKARSPKLPVILLSAVNEEPAGAAYADLFMSKLEGPVAMCQNISAVLARSKRATAKQLANYHLVALPVAPSPAQSGEELATEAGARTTCPR